MDHYTAHEAQTNLSQLLKRVSQGEELVIMKDGTPIARLVPFPPEPSPRKPGSLKGKIKIAPDFDDPLPEGFFDPC